MTSQLGKSTVAMHVIMLYCATSQEDNKIWSINKI